MAVSITEAVEGTPQGRERRLGIKVNSHDDAGRVPAARPAALAEYGEAPKGYRLPAEMRLGRVVLQVSDLERSLAYYRDIVGLRLLERGVDRVSMGAHGEAVPLVELQQKKGAAPVPRGGRLGLYHVAILLPDRAALGRFLTHLSRTGERMGASDHLVSEALYLNDPDGLGIEVYADRPRSEWRHVDRQLSMATAPLDVGGLSRAAQHEPWTGAPAGTTIGHVHLHVGDLVSAETFYHQGLGLDKVVWSYPGALFLSAGGYHHHLGVNSWAVAAAPAGETDARLLEWEIVLPTKEDCHGAAASLSSTGFMPDSSNGSVLVRDPWGTLLRIHSAH